MNFKKVNRDKTKKCKKPNQNNTAIIKMFLKSIFKNIVLKLLKIEIFEFFQDVNILTNCDLFYIVWWSSV